MGYYDLPAKIDHILNHTGSEKLFYIGHSQGTTALWVMLSERPEYNDKVKATFAMAPIAYVSNMFSPFFQYLAKYVGYIEVMILRSLHFFSVLL